MNSVDPAPVAGTHKHPVLKKSKTMAIVMSIFIGLYIWVYTYEKDKKKFWIGAIIQLILITYLIVSVLLTLFSVAEFSTEASNPDEIFSSFFSLWIKILLILLGLLGLRIWTVIDAAVKPSHWYEQYTSRPLNKTTALIVAMVFGLVSHSFVTWLYTYEKDSTKFWVAFGIGAMIYMLADGPLADESIFAWSVLVIILGLWVWTIIDVAMKPQAWYQNYPNHPSINNATSPK